MWFSPFSPHIAILHEICVLLLFTHHSGLFVTKKNENIFIPIFLSLSASFDTADLLTTLLFFKFCLIWFLVFFPQSLLWTSYSFPIPWVPVFSWILSSDLFSLYPFSLAENTNSSGFSYQFYINDIQIYISTLIFSPKILSYLCNCLLLFLQMHCEAQSVKCSLTQTPILPLIY